MFALGGGSIQQIQQAQQQQIQLIHQQQAQQQGQHPQQIQVGAFDQNAQMQQAIRNGVLLMNNFQVNQDIVLSLKVQGTNDAFGCAADCGCIPNVAKIPPQYTVPPAATEYISPTELNDIVQRFNHILETNFIPMLPLMFLHMCLPFSPICVLSHCSSRKTKKVDEFLASINQETYLRRSCHWETSSGPSIAGYGSLLPPSLTLIKHPAGSSNVAPTAQNAPVGAPPGTGAAESSSIPTGWNYQNTGTHTREF